MRLGCDGAHTGTATTVRDAEGLVQVQVGDVAAEVTEACKAGHRVEVGTINVNLTTRSVNCSSDVGYCVLVDTMSRGVSDHESGKGVTVLGDLGTQVIEVYVSNLVTRDDDNAHAGQHSRCCVRTVSAGRNQAHGALSVTVCQVVTTNSHQTG